MVNKIMPFPRQKNVKNKLISALANGKKSNRTFFGTEEVFAFYISSYRVAIWPLLKLYSRKYTFVACEHFFLNSAWKTLFVMTFKLK